MPKTTIFIGSSGAAKSQAKEVVRAFEGPTIEFLPWWEAFTAGQTLLDELDSIYERVDGALLLLSPESDTTLRGHVQTIPNLNVLFEFGYFLGCFERQKVGILRYGDYYLPSDLSGYIHIFGSSGFKRGRRQAVGKRTTAEFNRWISAF